MINALRVTKNGNCLSHLTNELTQKDEQVNDDNSSQGSHYIVWWKCKYIKLHENDYDLINYEMEW